LDKIKGKYIERKLLASPIFWMLSLSLAFFIYQGFVKHEWTDPLVSLGYTVLLGGLFLLIRRERFDKRELLNSLGFFFIPSLAVVIVKGIGLFF